MIINSRAQLAVKEALIRRAHWQFAEALLWIALRDVDVMAFYLQEPSVGWLTNPPIYVSQYMISGLAKEDVRGDVKPVVALHEALQQGAVIALGAECGGPMRPMSKTDWLGLKFRSADQNSSTLMAVRTPAQKDAPYSYYWSDIVFERSSLTTYFHESQVANSAGAASALDLDGKISAALLAMKAGHKPLAPRTIARYIIDQKWPDKPPAVRKKLIDKMRHWSPAAWAEILAIASTLGMETK
jgi:hypothetical protein